jgi:hypothetical protein
LASLVVSSLPLKSYDGRPAWSGAFPGSFCVMKDATSGPSGPVSFSFALSTNEETCNPNGSDGLARLLPAASSVSSSCSSS